ncbi:TPA: phage tail protein [Vibrio parahaemolyticus]|nr:phage tail protein [Vibrio parahaemolyticus]
MAAKYYTILTETGKAKLANAAALGRQLKMTQLAIGDGDGSEYDPVESQTSLRKEVYRAPISSLGTDTQNPNWVVAEGMIPVDVGGWFVREVGVFDEDGDMIAIGKYPETYKPTLAEGTGRDLYIRFVMVVSNTSVIDMKIDPTVEIATRTYVNEQLQKLGLVNLKQFNPKTTTDNTSVVQEAIDYAIANNLRYIQVDDDYPVSGDLKNRSNVIFVGEGSMPGVYRRDVIRIHEQAGGVYFNDLNPSLHLQKFSEAKLPKVVIMGDSISTHEPESISRNETFWSVLKEKIKVDNPGADVSFVNRAVPGQTWRHASTVPTRFPTWYTNQSRNWLEYVKDEEPDLLFLAFGMNDSSDFQNTHLHNVVNEIIGWEKVPDLVFVTNMVPSLETEYASELFTTKSQQEGRDYVAGYVRSYAKAKGYGLIDVNRMFNIARDGRDVCLSSFCREYDKEPTVNGVFKSKTECRDFSAVIYITGTSEEISEMFAGTHGTMACQVGADHNDVVFIKSNDQNKIVLEFYSGTGYLYKRLTLEHGVPINPFSMTFEKFGNSFWMRIGEGESVSNLAEVHDLITHGGVFNPKFGYFEGNYPSGPVDKVTFNYGVDKKYMPTILNDELWGSQANNNYIKMPWGGNGINHPTSLGVSAVYMPVLLLSSFYRDNRRKYKVVDQEKPNVIGLLSTGLEEWDDPLNKGHVYIGNAGTTAVGLVQGNKVVIWITGDSFYPQADNTFNMGGASNRWKNVFSTNGTIMTSDARLKTDIDDLPPELLLAVKDIRFKQFRMKDAVALKGDGARLHVGVLAQDVIAVFESYNLDAFLYGIVCQDPETKKYMVRYDELQNLALAALMSA